MASLIDCVPAGPFPLMMMLVNDLIHPTLKVPRPGH